MRFVQLTLAEQHAICEKARDKIALWAFCQQAVFEMVGLPMVENCLAGFNSSIFAYGQVEHPPLLPCRTKFPRKVVNVLQHHGCLELQSANLSLRVSHADIDFDGMWIRLGVEKPTQCGVQCLIPTLTCHPLRTVALHRVSLSGYLLAFTRYKLVGILAIGAPPFPIITVIAL